MQAPGTGNTAPHSIPLYLGPCLCRSATVSAAVSAAVSGAVSAAVAVAVAITICR